MARMMVAQQGFAGEGYTVAAGEIFSDDHPVVRSTPAEWWFPWKEREINVEQATAAPGEKRKVSMKAPTTEAKPDAARK